MDAAEEDQDVRLQRASVDLIAGFERAVPVLLWKKHGTKEQKTRKHVRRRDAVRLANLLEPFQELPQLLDQHLGKFVPLLADALLELLRAPVKTVDTKPVASKPNPLLMPTSEAICKLLYTFCKVRGEKVIVRFFSAETRHLEVLLSAFEDADAVSEQTSHEDEMTPQWSWEEQYIVLLWLSHLLLAPFDLATISSGGTEDTARAKIPGLTWPANLPTVAQRVIPLAIKYLATAGKIRDSAKVLLVRISMRKDMQELGLLHVLVDWALSQLQSVKVGVSNYFYIGILSYLAGVLVSSSDTSDMDAYLFGIFSVVQDADAGEDSAIKVIYASALGRKAVIKILRTIALLSLKGSTISSPDVRLHTTEMVETTIGHLLEALADNDTPVRLAASKALSVVTLKLAPTMASQVVEAVLDSLNNNILWHDQVLDGKTIKVRDITAVNPLEWHGLILTLSHLLYRRSPPLSILPDILNALIIGLCFEQRSTSGSSIGTNVRDAACFGIWALARRYTTTELQGVPTASISAASTHDSSTSIIQVLATELVVSACLDSAGNIRRGASAALQELIGRHPDIVAEGIAVVQVVDYHAVALRSRAVLEVAPSAAKLSEHYEVALLTALFGWRGVGDGDVTSRRNAGTAVGYLSATMNLKKESKLLERIHLQWKGIQARDMDQRHGLMLSMAAVLSSMSTSLDTRIIDQAIAKSTEIISVLSQVLVIIELVLQDSLSSSYRRPELMAEAGSRMISAACPFLRTDIVIRTLQGDPGSATLRDALMPCLYYHGTSSSTMFASDDNGTSSSSYQQRTVVGLDVAQSKGHDCNVTIYSLMDAALDTWLLRSEKEVIAAASEAAYGLFMTINSSQRIAIVSKCASNIVGSSSEANRANPCKGHLSALATISPILPPEEQRFICNAIAQRWAISKEIESKVAILQALCCGIRLDIYGEIFVDIINEGLDDYTTDTRGDVGSLVRLEACKTAARIFSSWPSTRSQDELKAEEELWLKDDECFGSLYSRVLRLAAEKLDKVRTEAQLALVEVCYNQSQQQCFKGLSNSSEEYFYFLLKSTSDTVNFASFNHRSKPYQYTSALLEGYVSSADTGSEGLIRASRTALVSFCNNTKKAESELSEDSSSPPGESSPSDRHLRAVCEALFEVLKRNIANDRVLVPTLEIIGFLFDAGIMWRSAISWEKLYIQVQKAHYKSGNVRKLEAAVKLYGGLMKGFPEARTKLLGMLLHPFPGIRNLVVDVLWVGGVTGTGTEREIDRGSRADNDVLLDGNGAVCEERAVEGLKGIDWTKAKKDDLVRLRGQMGIV